MEFGHTHAGRPGVSDMSMQAPIPILRMFDEVKARAFYIDYLGFQVVFEHRFEPDLPLYMEVVRGACRLHLSEHHGDCTPGSAVRIKVDDAPAMAAELAGKSYKPLRPGIETTPWDTYEVCLTDPFGNRIILYADKPL